MRPILYLITSCLITLQSCDITKKIFKKKESTQTETNHASTTSSRTTNSSNWIRSGSSMLSRDGSLVITFDGVSSIDISPEGQLRATGQNPTIISSTAETRKDTTAELSSLTSRSQIETDSTANSKASKEEEVLIVDKEQKTQKIAPIIVLIGMALLTIFWIVKKIKIT